MPGGLTTIFSVVIILGIFAGIWFIDLSKNSPNLTEEKR